MKGQFSGAPARVEPRCISMKRAFLLTFVFLLLAGLTGGLAWFHLVYKPEMIRGFITAAPQPVLSVAVEEARAETWVPRAPAIGTFRAMKGVELAPQVAGVIVDISFESGQDVKAGVTLVQIDDSVEQADLKANEATLRNAELALDRQRQLVGAAATTKANLDTARTARDAAAAAVDRTRALIRQKKLVAPFSGRLGLRRVDVGQYVSPGTTVVSLQQLDPMLIDFPMPEQRIGQLREGQEIEVEVDAYPGRVFRGAIASIDARVSPETRNILVRGEIPNADEALRPGMFGNVSVVAGAAREVVTAPRTAISYSLYGDAVFVLTPDGEAKGEAGAMDKATDKPDAPEVFRAERRFVRSGEARGDRVSIVEGVKPGERLVTEGQIRLQPGARVKIGAPSLGEPPKTLPRE